MHCSRELDRIARARYREDPTGEGAHGSRFGRREQVKDCINGQHLHGSGAGAHEHGVNIGVGGRELLGGFCEVPLLAVEEAAKLVHVRKHVPAVVTAGHLYMQAAATAAAGTAEAGLRTPIY